MSLDPAFVHLHVHTAFSLREGALGLARLVELAERDGQPAIGVADTNNLFAALELSEKAAKAGLQSLPGAQLTIDFEESAERGPGRRDRTFGNLVLIAKSRAGYLNLMRLCSRAHLAAHPGEPPALTLADLAADGEDILALTGGPQGALDPLVAEGRAVAAEARLKALRALFPDRLYVEIQRHGLAAERAAEAPLLDMAYRLGLPLVATNEPFFAARAEFEAHDALLCIAEGSVASRPIGGA